jgi:ADP-dependent NAD(P)H-hydrate dehydratase / NAD(P)H-hydrate epimerase
MLWIATAEEIREMDRLAQEAGVSVEQLMHEAGRALAACVLEEFPGAVHVAVVCGRGNNGGDGLVAARLLREHQREVRVLVAAYEHELTEHPRRELASLREPGVTPVFFGGAQWHTALEGLGRADVIVDAILGTGTRGAPEGVVADAIEAINQARRPVVAADIPSGILCDTGEAPGVAVRAVRTVTFGLPKPFLFQGEGLERSGDWTAAPIGFPEALLDAPRGAALAEVEDVARLLPVRTAGAHKGSEGHVLVAAGHRRMPGAAVLSAYAALRAGAGLVTIASTEEVCRMVAVHIPEAVLMPLPDEGGCLGRDASEILSRELARFDAAVFGPGLSTDPPARAFLERVWKDWKGPCVVDADALNLVAKGAALPSAPCLLTPHPGEAGRLLGSPPDEVQRDRFAAVRAVRDRFGQTALLKGAATLVLGEGPVRVNPTGHAAMAAPGVGDVLCGVLASLLAKKLSPEHAATAGAYWHGLAGELAAQRIGPAGLLASEVADALPGARATIWATCEEA